jgi:hypothetical protein
MRAGGRFLSYGASINFIFDRGRECASARAAGGTGSARAHHASLRTPRRKRKIVKTRVPRAAPHAPSIAMKLPRHAKTHAGQGAVARFRGRSGAFRHRFCAVRVSKTNIAKSFARPTKTIFLKYYRLR